MLRISERRTAIYAGDGLCLADEMMRQTLLTFLDDCASRSTETALLHRRGLRVSRWSYAQVAATAFQFARELEAREINQGDRVLFWAENAPEWVAAFFGCLLRGVIVVPLDAQSAPDFVARVQQQVKARLLLYSVCERRGLDDKLPGLQLDDLSQAISRHSTEPYAVKGAASDDVVEIIYTSGTTAEPKGVILTHRNLLANLSPLEQEIKKYLKWERLVHPVRFLNLVPLSHVFGQFMGIFVPQLLGGELFFQESLNPSEIISTVRRERISVIVAVPRLLDGLRQKLERDWAARGQAERRKRALASAEGWHFLRRWWAFRDVHRQFGWKFWAFVSGGATLDPETETFWQRLGFVVVQGYGMTESASLISVNHPFKKSRGSIGKTLPGQEVMLDESGEIMVRGENVSPGYWSDNGQLLRNKEGWLRTGDIGEMDEAGNLYFKGRRKDVIVTAAGLNIYPEDVEAALNRQPEVRASVVVGIEGARGPEPLAVLILHDRHTDPQAAIGRANKMLAQHQQVRRWYVWPESDFPRTVTQKVRKREVAEAVKGYLAGNISEREEQSTSLTQIIAHISTMPPSRLDRDANLTTDLKLDSLGRVELLSALEDHYQVDIDEAAFTSATTLGDIEKMIHEGVSLTPPQYPYPEWAQHFPVTWIRRLFYYLVTAPLTSLMCWMWVNGREHLDGVDGPVLFVSNHITMLDHALIMRALPRHFRRRLAIAMEGERLRAWRHPPDGTNLIMRLFWLVPYALVVSFFNVFPLPKKSGFRRSFAFAGELMDGGHSVLVFPEGERTEDGQMHPFMAGVGLLAKNLNAPVVPVGIDGLFELKRRRKHFAPFSKVSVTFGRPVRFTGQEEPTQITRELERYVATLAAEKNWL